MSKKVDKREGRITQINIQVCEGREYRRLRVRKRELIAKLESLYTPVPPTI
jgi:hypothetical protein